MSKNIDLVSVIIRTKDRPDFLARAIESVCLQSWKKIEIIIVNDGGCDVEKVINKYKTKYKKQKISFVYLKNKNSVSRSEAANLGLKVAKGKYLCLLDDDDYFYPNYLSEHINTQQKNKTAWSVSKTIELVETPKGKKIKKQDGRSYEFNEIKFLFFENYFPSNSVVFQKKLVDKVGFFDKKLQVLEDWDMWIRMYLESKPSFINKKLSVYSTRKGELNIRTSVKSRKIWQDSFMIVMNKYKKEGYKVNNNISTIDLIKYLPDHSQKWYLTKEENKELKDSWAHKIYKNVFYCKLKRVFNIFNLNSLD